MMHLWRAEVRKLRYTRSLWLLPVGGALVSIVGASLFIGLLPTAELADRVSAHGPLRFGPTNTGLLLLILSLRIVADEHHHGTTAATYLATPQRHRVLVAKAVLVTATTVAFCTVVLGSVLAVTLLGREARDLQMTFDAAATGALFARTTLAMVLLSLVGVGLAVAIRNRTVVLVAVLAWLALAEDLIGAVLKIPELLPGAAVQALVSGNGGHDTLSPEAAALVLVALVVAVFAAATTSIRRDVP